MKLNSVDVWAHLAPMFHLVDVFAIYAITLVGGRHVTLPNFSAIDALHCMERECVSVVNMASTMVSMLVNNPMVENFDLSCLRVLSCGGSPQSPAVITRAIAIFGCEFFLSYGMTETCGKISMSILPDNLESLEPCNQYELVCTSGRPFNMVDVRVVDENGVDVPKDGKSVGEVWVKGSTVFSGYVGLPEATEDAFNAGNWFKTGDLAVVRSDNYISVVDRKKDMLLVGGENVYSTEVEAVLHEHPSVHQAAVFGVPNRVMGELVGAAVTVVPGTTSVPTSKELISWCRSRLAEYKVPYVVHVVDRFPTTGSGKILKTRLREVFAASAGHSGAPPMGIKSLVESDVNSLVSTKRNEDAAIFSSDAKKVSSLRTAGGLEMVVGQLMSACSISAAFSVQEALTTADGHALYADMSYVVLVERSDQIGECFKQLSEMHLANVAMICLERPHASDLQSLRSHAKASILILHLDPLSFDLMDVNSINGALAVVRSRLPPIAGILYWMEAETASQQRQHAPSGQAPLESGEGKVPDRDSIRKMILSALKALVGDSSAAHIESGEPLMAAGVTSTLAVQLVTELESLLGIQIPGTLVFDYPSLEEMTDYLIDTLQLSTVVSSAKSTSLGGGRISHLEMNGGMPLGIAPQVSFSTNLSRAPQISSMQGSGDVKSDIFAVVKEQIQELTGNYDGQIAVDVPLMEAGVTSTLAVQLVSGLEIALGIELPGTLVFDYPSIVEITNYICEQTDAMGQFSGSERMELISGIQAEQIPNSGIISGAPEPFGQVCVITSSSHNIPQGSLHIQTKAGNDRISFVPLERWDVDECPIDNPMEINLQFGSFLDDVSFFDANLFGISPAEAVLMDPQQRLVMGTFAEALLGHRELHEPVRNTGVFVGVSQLDYARTAYETGSALNTYYATGSHLSVTSGRLSYTHGFKGPAMTVDTACSSSLVTTHLAARSLFDGESIVSGTVGVNLTLVHSWTRACLRAGMLADDGRCKTLDASADGYVRAEAIGALILTLITPSKTDRGGTRGENVISDVHGRDYWNSLVVLAGTAVNQDGRSSSLTAPNGPAQQEVIMSAIQDSGIASAQVAQLQMHGTGTPLGDPIELGAVSAVLLRPGSLRKWPLQLSAAKSFMGHGEPAAGIVGLTRLAICLGNLESDSFVSLRTMNPYVSATISGSRQHGALHAYSVARQLAPEPSVPSIISGGVSAFAFQGTNAHAVVSKDHGSENSVSFTLYGVTTASSRNFNFQKIRYWVLPVPYPFIKSYAMKKHSRNSRLEIFEGDLLSPRLGAVYPDHKVFDRVLFPAAGMAEAAIQATSTLLESSSRTPVGISSMSIASPIIFPCENDGLKSARSLILRCSVDILSGNFSLSYRQKGTMNTDVAIGNCVVPSSKTIMHSNFPGKKRRELLPENLGFELSPRLLKGEEKDASSPSPVGNILCERRFIADGYIIPPMLLDANFHLGVIAPNSGAKVPISIGCLGASLDRDALQSGFEETLYARTTALYSSTKSEIDVASFKLSLRGDVAFAHLSDMETKVIRHKGKAGSVVRDQKHVAEHLYEMEWGEISEPALRSPALVLNEMANLILSDGQGVGLSTHIKLNCPLSSVAISGLELAQAFGSSESMSKMQANMMEVLNNTLIHRDNGRESSHMATGALEGLLRVVSAENATADVTLSLSQSPSTEAIPHPKPFNGALVTSRERNGAVACPRLVRSVHVLPSKDMIQIRPQPRGSLNSLAVVPFQGKSCKPESVRMAVKAVGINFRDVLNVLGMYPGDPGPPGSDCAGVIIESGNLVDDMEPGQAVYGLAHGCLGSIVESPRETLVHMPSNITFSEASTMPTVFTTVYIALKKAASLSSGEVALVHAAAGGVGLAAMQLARAEGSEIIATAGGPSKRSLIHSLGVDHVLGSRDTSFASESSILGGADIVLNSLTSTGMVAASLSALRHGGRFIEISKRDIWSTKRIVQDRPDVSYCLLAVDFLANGVIQSALQSITNSIARGQILPLRNICHTMGNIAAALRQLTHASHVGKVVTSTSIPHDVPHPFEKAKEGSIAITGGSGGLALMMTKWMIQRFHEISANLICRSGRITNKSAAVFLLKSNARIAVTMADVSITADSRESLTAQQERPIRSLMHASGVLQDSMLDKQNAGSFRKVYAPKLGGVQAINVLTQWMPLETLSLFSSIASLLGGAGQGNYASANAALDAWSYSLQAAGAACLSVQWGAWASAGMATEAVLNRLNRIGQGMITAEQGLVALSAILRGPKALGHVQPQLTVNDFLWSTYLKNSCAPQFQNFAPMSSYTTEVDVVSVKGRGQFNNGMSTRRDPVASPAAIRESVHHEVTDAIVQVLGTSIGENEPLMSAGLDSLGSVEFSNLLASKLTIQIPGTLVFDYPSVAAVTDYIVSQLACASEHEDEQFEEMSPFSSHALWMSDAREISERVSSSHFHVASCKRRPFVRPDAPSGTIGDWSDRIQRIPCSRWDLDVMETLTGEQFTLAAQVRCYRMSMMYSGFLQDRISSQNLLGFLLFA